MTASVIPGVTAEHRHDAYEGLLGDASLDPVVTAVAYPCERTALTGVIEAAEARLIAPILVGPRQTIREVAQEAGLNLDAYPVEDVSDARAAAAKAVELVRSGRPKR